MPKGLQQCLSDSGLAHAWWRIPINVSACCLKLVDRQFPFHMLQSRAAKDMQMFIFRHFCSEEALVPCSLAEQGKSPSAPEPIPFGWIFRRTAGGTTASKHFANPLPRHPAVPGLEPVPTAGKILFPVIHCLSFPSSRSRFFFSSAPLLNLGHRRCSVLPSGLSFIRFTMVLCSNSNHKLLALNATLLETLSKGL